MQPGLPLSADIASQNMHALYFFVTQFEYIIYSLLSCCGGHIKERLEDLCISNAGR